MNARRSLAIGLALSVLVTSALAGRASAQAKPEGEMRFALYVTLSPVWLDPTGLHPGARGPLPHGGDGSRDPRCPLPAP